MFGKLILRIFFVQHPGDVAVTADLRQNRRRRDAHALSVAADDRPVRRGDGILRAVVAVAVDEGEVRLYGQTVDGKLHRLHAGVENVDLVDLPCVDGGNTVCDRLFTNDVKKRFALLLRQLFGVVQPLDHAVRRQDHGSSVHRSHQRTGAGFIHAADLCAAGGKRFALAGIINAHDGSSGTVSSVKRPSLPPRNSSSKIRLMRSVSTSPPEMRKPRLRAAFCSSAHPSSPSSAVTL